MDASGTGIPADAGGTKIPLGMGGDGTGIPLDMDTDRAGIPDNANGTKIPLDMGSDGAGIPLDMDTDRAGILLDVGAERAGIPLDMDTDRAGIPNDTEGAGIPQDMDAEAAGSPVDSDTAERRCLSLEELGDYFQECIEIVEQLERERDELISELAQLREPALQEIRHAHQEIQAACRLLAKVELERDNLRDEIRQIKQKLFKVTKECVACQYQLESRRHDLSVSPLCPPSWEGYFWPGLRDKAIQYLQEHFWQRGSKLISSFSTLSVLSSQSLPPPRSFWKLPFPIHHGFALKLLGQSQGSNREQEPSPDAFFPIQEQVEELEDRLKELKNGVQLQQRKNQELEELRSSLHRELSIYKWVELLELFVWFHSAFHSGEFLNLQKVWGLFYSPLWPTANRDLMEIPAVASQKAGVATEVVLSLGVHVKMKFGSRAVDDGTVCAWFYSVFHSG
uniref:Uncharacterized protein n=1 Tax=Malurus cyaneus samueli TaxID=2593467 RepID=A0A8C5X571_9PASS